MFLKMLAGGRLRRLLGALLFACSLTLIASDHLDFMEEMHHFDFNQTNPKKPSSSRGLDDEQKMQETIRYKVEKEIESFIRKGFERADKILKERSQDVTNGSERNDLEQFHSRTVAGVDVQHMSECKGLGMLETSKLVAEHFKIPNNEVHEVLDSITIPVHICKAIDEKCIATGKGLSRHLADFTVGPCNGASKYRTADGTCNNLNNPQLGAAGTIVGRFLRPNYADGVDSPRVSRTGAPLPNPRTISSAMFNSKPNPPPSTSMTQLVQTWGQFIDHDITRTPQSTVISNGVAQTISCCQTGKLPFGPLPRDCLPIDVSDDSFYRSKGVSCLRFVRSLASSCMSCKLGARSQVNAVTSYIDASQIYGSSNADQINLRRLTGGLLKTSSFVETGRCPTLSSPCALSFLFQNPSSTAHEFLAGDVRVNENPTLTSLQTIFSRYHNKVAGALNRLNPQWSDEIIFQEARRIVGAIIQHTTYSEFLPIVLGKANMINFNLVPATKDFFFSYKASVNPSITSSFSTAAYRFGHSLVGNNFRGANGILEPMSKNFGTSSILTQPEWFPSETIQGECNLPSENVDVSLVNAIRNFLFAAGPAFDHGFDLLAINIMRGRDHGLPSYNNWRAFCGLRKFGNFSDLINSGEMDVNAASAFSRLYASVEDLDLYPAGLAENPSVNGILGPTFSCILGHQFRNLRFGDRFWYENGNMKNSFTEPQLAAIKKTTLSSIICETTTALGLQKWPMLTSVDPRNVPIGCITLIGSSSLLLPENIAAWKA